MSPLERMLSRIAAQTKPGVDCDLGLTSADHTVCCSGRLDRRRRLADRTADCRAGNDGKGAWRAGRAGDSVVVISLMSSSRCNAACALETCVALKASSGLAVRL